jgi:hypothetical protein
MIATNKSIKFQTAIVTPDLTSEVILLLFLKKLKFFFKEASCNDCFLFTNLPVNCYFGA